MRTRSLLPAALAIGCLALWPLEAAAQRGHGGGAASHAATAAATHGSPASTHGNPHTTASTSGTRTTAATTLNPIALKLQGTPLGHRLATLLPAGMSLDTASSGFRNQGQFVAALHVSHNLGIPFSQLKTAMLGTTTTAPLSLGRAIHKLRPSANASAEAQRAETEASAELKRHQ